MCALPAAIKGTKHCLSFLRRRWRFDNHSETLILGAETEEYSGLASSCEVKKKVELSEHCDGIYYFPWAQEAHRVLAGVVLTDCRREVTLLSPFSDISTKALQ